MKYTSQVEINVPLEHAVALFKNPDNYNKWMEGLQEFEPLSGSYGEPGSKARFKFKNAGREIEMVQTVFSNNLPEAYNVTYEANGVFNRVITSFEKISGESCLCINEQEFRFKGIMRILAMLMPGAFKKQSMKILSDFKEFAENA